MILPGKRVDYSGHLVIVMAPSQCPCISKLLYAPHMDTWTGRTTSKSVDTPTLAKYENWVDLVNLNFTRSNL